MALFYVAYQSVSGAFLGAAIVEAFDPFKAREQAEAAGIHQPGALSVVDRIDAAPPELIDRKLMPRDLVAIVRNMKKPPAASVRRRRDAQHRA